MPWFCPLPWKTIDCEMDLQPNGMFRTTMQSPEGKEFPNSDCCLQVIPHEKLGWTNALLLGFRPTAPSPTCGDELADFKFTVMVEVANFGSSEHDTATVIRADEAGSKKHAAMGFEQGWGIALEQLIALVRKGI